MGGEGAGCSNVGGTGSLTVVVSSSPHAGVYQPVLQCTQLHAEGGGPVCPRRLLPELQGEPPVCPPLCPPTCLWAEQGDMAPRAPPHPATHTLRVPEVNPLPVPNEEGYM